MTNTDLDSRLESWLNLRKQVDQSLDPFRDVIDFWNKVSLTAHNHLIDHYYSGNWPTPWEIIETNRYDDFTKAIMIGYTLLLTEKYKNSDIQIRTLLDKQHNKLYNVVYVDDLYVLNFCDNGAISPDEIPESCCTENLIVLARPR